MIGTTDLPLRPLEAQAIQYVETDDDASTDDHNFAQPLFWAAGGPTTDPAVSMLAWAGRIVEVSGRYLQLAIGSGHAMARRIDGSGWDVLETSGAVATTNPQAVGLVIRERQVPDTAIWPGAAQVTALAPSNASYMPYAYGKHLRPSNWPFFIADVSDGVFPNAGHNHNDDSNSGDLRLGTTNESGRGWGRFGLDVDGSVTRQAINNGSSLRAHTYQEGGTVQITAAVAEGRAPFFDGVDVNSHEGYNRFPRFYADNWRFVHLRRPSFDNETAAGAPTPGVTVRWFKDTFPLNESSHQNGSYRSFYGGDSRRDRFSLLGTPQAIINRAVIDTANVAAAPGGGFIRPNAPPVAITNYTRRSSARIEGYLVPQFSEVYTLRVANLRDGVRVWLDGRMLTEPTSWRNQGLATIEFTTEFPLSAGVGYHLVVDYYNNNDNDPSMQLLWRSATQAQQIIPTGTAVLPNRGLYRMTAASDPAFAAANFVGIQTRVSTADFVNGVGEKAALMLRNADAGLSPLLNARDRFMAIAFNPQRGFFVQRRLEPAKPLPTDVVNPSYFIGRGSATQTSPSALAIVSANGVMTTLSNRHTHTVSANGVNYTYNPYTRNAVLTPDLPATDYSGLLYDYGMLTQTPKNSFAQTNGFTISMGDGVNVFVRAGTTTNAPVTAIQERYRQRQIRAFRSRHVYLNLSGHESGFIPADQGDPISIFAAASTSTTNSIDGALSGNIGLVVSSTRIRLDYRENAAWSAWVDGATASNSVTVQPNWVYGNPSNAVVTEMNLSGVGSRSNWEKAPAGAPSPDVSGRVYAPSTDPAYPSYPAAPNTFTASTHWNATVPRSFAVNRGATGRGVVHDVNSYVTAYGSWFTPTVAQHLPWNPEWNTLFTAWATAPTGGFRPDLWAHPALTPNVAPLLNDAQRSVVTAGRWLDDQPNPNGGAMPALGDFVWLRIEKAPGFPNVVRFRYSLAETPTAADWQSIRNQAGADLTADITGWTTVHAGPAVQSGSVTAASTISFDNLQVEFLAPVAGDTNADSVLNATDWDVVAGGRPTATSRYLASQYQVFWGVYDITEDFFSYCELNPDARTATEDWIHSPREFWRQNRRWDNGVAKDLPDTHDNITNRVLWSKTTLLSLNMGSDLTGDHAPDEAGLQRAGIQGYLRSRTLTEAVRKPMSGLAEPIVAPADDGLLFNQFNGLLYAARTNRYPFNPNRSNAVNGGRNPWSFDNGRPYPNTFTGGNTVLNDPNDYANLGPATLGWANFTVGAPAVHRLQPYGLPLAPPIKPQEFHHGVRVHNASHIWYGYVANTLGEGRLSIVSPNQVYLHGDVNRVTNNITTPNSPVTARAKHTPMAVFGDAIHLLSNAFRIDRWQNPGIGTNAAGAYWGTGVLGNPTAFAAADTEYWTCLLTHNTPTTRHSVREVQGAAFVDTMMFMENWTGRTMRYVGSLVMFDSRRYTRAFLLDANKGVGRTVFGNTLSNTLTPAARAIWEGVHGAGEWNGQTPLGYNPPSRIYAFNDDLLTAQGTPPFTPFGLTVSGLGGWSRIIQ